DIFHSFEDFEIERKNLPIITMLVRNLKQFHKLSFFQQDNMIGLIHDVLRNPPLVYKGVQAYYNSILSDEDVDTEDTTRKKTSLSEEEQEKRFHIKDLIEDSVVDKKLGRTFSYDKIKKLTQTTKGRQQLIRRLQDYHFLSNFLFRNRKRKIFSDKFVQRIVENIEVYQTDEEANIYKEIRLYLAKTYNEAVDSKNPALGFVMVVLQKLLTSSPKALISSLEKRIVKVKDVIRKKESKQKQQSIPKDKEEEFFSLTELDDMDEVIAYSGKVNEESALIRKEIDYLSKHLEILQDFLGRLKKLKTDSKLNALVKIAKSLLNKNKNKKIIIFTQFKKTLFYIRDTLRNLGFIVEEFHGDLDRNAKERSVEQFKLSGDVLVSTEVGGEGRNFQFCNVLINYDLPWNPMKLEQRIGRLDRIGQKDDILIFNFLIMGTVESRIMEILAKRINLFTESIGNLEPIIANLEKSINKAVFSEDNLYNTTADFEGVIIDEQNKLEEVSAQLEDFILDRKSFQLDKIDGIIKSASELNDEDIIAFINTFFNKYHPNNQIVGKIDHLQHPSKMGYSKITIDNDLRNILNLKKRSFSGVFSLEKAQKIEELDFFALGHPLINSLMEFCKSEDLGQPYSFLPISTPILKKFMEDTKLEDGERKICESFIARKENLMIFVLESEICGVFIERVIKPVVITHSGVILKSLSKFLTIPRNFNRIMIHGSTKEVENNLPSLKKEELEKLEEIARKFFNKTNARNKKQLDSLNETMFNKELQRTLALGQYKRDYILNKIRLHSKRLKALETRVPTKRQWNNVYKIEDEAKRKEREGKFNAITREMQALNIEMDDLQRDLTEIEFDMPDDIKRLEFYRKLSRRIQLISIGRLFHV
ncbi:MAG: helicase-related protein, partial [Promethearchaeota archaeon]